MNTGENGYQRQQVGAVHTRYGKNMVETGFGKVSSSLPRNAGLVAGQDRLQEAATAGTADKLTVNKVLTGKENLVNTGIGAPAIKAFGFLPMFIQGLVSQFYENVPKKGSPQSENLSRYARIGE